MKKVILSITVLLLLLSFAPVNEFSNWSVKSKKAEAMKNKGIVEYNVKKGSSENSVVFFDSQDTLIITENEKYSGNPKAKRKLEVITNMLSNVVYSVPLRNNKPAMLEIPLGKLTNNNASKADWYEIDEVVNVNGHIKKAQVIRFGLN